MDLPQLLKEWILPLGGLGGLAASIKLWIDAGTAKRAAAEVKAVQRTDLVKIAQEAAGAVIADLRIEAHRLRERLEEIEAEFATFRKAHDKMVADKDAELALLRGENRELKATIEAYERLLSAHNIPHKPPPRPFYEVREGRVEAVIVETPNS